MKSQEYILDFAGNPIRFQSEWELAASDTMAPLLREAGLCDYHVRVCEVPVPMDDMLPDEKYRCGEDALLLYYQTETAFFALAKRGLKAPVTLAHCSLDMHEITLYVNQADHPGSVASLEKVLQMIPTRRILMGMEHILLHSSRVKVNSKAVLFTAPSGTGKTTQAGLWHRFMQAEICSNDRTLIRSAENGCHTFSYPDDGSTPVYTKDAVPLAAIVALRQEKTNRIQKLSAFQAMKYLLSQSLIDTWDPAARLKIQELWFHVLEQVPVYLLGCTADERAVECLHDQLEKDGVL